MIDGVRYSESFGGTQATIPFLWQMLRPQGVVAEDASELLQRDVYPYVLARQDVRRPILWISRETAEMLLGTAGSSLAELDEFRASLQPARIRLTGEGAAVELAVPADRSEGMLDEAYLNVIEVIAGQGYMLGKIGEQPHIPAVKGVGPVRAQRYHALEV